MITELDKKTVLVLIDLQQGIIKTGKAHPVKDIISKAASLAEAFRRAGLPVVIVNVNPAGAAWTKRRVEISTLPQNAIVQTLTKIAMPITGFTDIVPELNTQQNDIFITKRTWNAFFNTPLREELNKREVTGIVLAGVSTSIGVEGTARAASELGYNISFAIDAMTDTKLEAHQNSIKNIFPRIGETGTVQDIINKLPLN